MGQKITDWQLHRQPGGYLLVDRDTLTYVRLSALAVELFLQLSRGEGLDRLAAIRAYQDNMEKEEAKTLLNDLLYDHPLTASWLTHVPESLTISGSSEYYYPLSASLQLTNGCNLTCPFCYASSGKKRSNELNANQWIAVLEKLAIVGCQSVTLTGGEPTLLANFREVVIAASCYFRNVAVFTNGYALSDNLINLFANLGNIAVQVSLDGLEAVHNSIRGGHDAFNKTIKNVSKLVEAGIDVDIATVVTNRSVADLPELIEILDDVGVESLRLGFVQNLGRAKDGFETWAGRDQAELEIAQLLDEVIHSTKTINIAPWNNCKNTTELIESATGLTGDFSTPGLLSWHIMSDGNVTPCQLEETQFFGNILSDPLHKIADRGAIIAACSNSIGCTCARYVEVPQDEDIPFGIEL